MGSAGGRQDDIAIGTPVILSASHRGRGTSKVYLPVEFPAVADLDVTNALVDAARELGDPFRVGIGFTRDAYYVQDKALNELLKKVGVVAASKKPRSSLSWASAGACGSAPWSRQTLTFGCRCSRHWKKKRRCTERGKRKRSRSPCARCSCWLRGVFTRRLCFSLVSDSGRAYPPCSGNASQCIVPGALYDSIGFVTA